jgi:hypothetical protein
MVMGDPPADRPGWLDEATQRLRPLLRSARFKAGLRRLLARIDPAYAPELVRTAVWTDPSLVLSLLQALPRAANALLLTGRGLCEQAEKLAPALQAAFLRDLLGRIELGVAGELAGRSTRLSLALATEQQDWPALARAYSAGFARALDAEALAAALAAAAPVLERMVADHEDWIQAGSRALRQVLADHPRLVDRGLAPLLRPLLEAVAA